MFIKNTREKVTEGTLALFLMTSDAAQNKAAEELKGYDFELIASNLTQEQEEQLKAAFAEECFLELTGLQEPVSYSDNQGEQHYAR